MKYEYLVRFHRSTYPLDDIVGGAVPVLSLLIDNVPARISHIKPTYPLLEQGVEVRDIYTVSTNYLAKNVKEHDLMEVFIPVDSIYATKYFRVIGIRHSSIRTNDPRNQIILTVRRYDYGTRTETEQA